MVQVVKTTEGTFSEEDRLVLLHLVQMTSLAVENARLYQRSQDAITSQQQREDVTQVLTSYVTGELQTLLATFASYLQTAHLALERVRARTLVSTQESLLLRLQQQVQHVSSQLEHARSLLTWMQDYMLVQSNRLKLDMTDAADMVQLARAVIAQVRGRGLQRLFMVVADEEPLWVRCDSVRMQEVLTTLLTYAATCSTEGTIITVRLQYEMTDGGTLVSVQYEGPERRKEEHDHLFDVGYWLKREPVSQNLELGLSLYLSAEVITLHGGRIWSEQQRTYQHLCFVLPKSPTLER
jgi:K+-sensing histidine kinase KdpD